MRFIALDKRLLTGYRRAERGQTIILVAVSLISLLAMAALAVDVVTLYTARSEIQRAADAAALAAAKGIADSGITTLSATDLTNDAGITTLAQNMAIANANAALASTNYVAGSQIPSGSITVQFCTSAGTCSGSISTSPRPNSWLVKVSLQQSNLPTFFARIWSRTAPTASASATAEAYNPANFPTLPNTFTPIAPRCVKPWLVANQDPTQPIASPTPFFTAGAVETGLLNKTFDLTPDCTNNDCLPYSDNPPKVKSTANGQTVEFIAATVASNPNNVCPSCSSGSPYQQSIECCDQNSYAYYLNCGGETGGNPNYMQWDSSVDIGGNGGSGGVCAVGSECLINATSAGSNQGQDTLDTSPWPTSPRLIHPGGGATSASTSRSVVTIPVIDNTNPINPATPNVTIVGFLQAFINCVEDGTQKNCDQAGLSNPGDINITVLNAVGCGTNFNAANPIVGGNGTSPIPVRLISP